jgi:hypothetical protein
VSTSGGSSWEELEIASCEEELHSREVFAFSSTTLGRDGSGDCEFGDLSRHHVPHRDATERNATPVGDRCGDVASV